MTGVPVDVPPGDDVTEPWWEATRSRRLLVQECAACGTRQHPPRALCTGCARTDSLGWRPVAGEASVDACTVVERAPSSEFEAPYVLARVRLPEGPLLLTNVVGADPYAVAIGDPVRLTWRPLADGRALPVFTLADPITTDTATAEET